MKKREKIVIMLLFSVILMCIALSSSPFKAKIGKASPINGSYKQSSSSEGFSVKASSYDPPWWNLTYHYRKPIVITEPNRVDRENEPVEVQLTFDSLKAHKNSLRLLYYDGNTWIGPLPIQIDDIVYDSENSDYIRSVKITFLANVSKGKTEVYYIYYTDYPVEEKTYSTDLHVNESMISNSYFTWWINPPKIFRYPNDTGVDWNTIDNGWIGYPQWYGADLNNPTYVELLYNGTLVVGPVYAKVLYRYKVQVYSWASKKYYNYYKITLTIYARTPIVRVDMEIEPGSYTTRGVWGTIMDVEGDVDDDKYAFFTDPVTVGTVGISNYRQRESYLHDMNGWTWATLYEPGKHGVGVIVHKDYTPEYYPLYVSRAVKSTYSDVIYGYTFIFAYIYGSSGTYYYRFFDVPIIGDAWDPVNETTIAIAYPLSNNYYVDVEQEAYYLLSITVEDAVSRKIEGAKIVVYNSSNPNDIFGTNLTSSSGEAVIKFYRNVSLTVGIKVNYTTTSEIYVEKSTSVSLDIDDVRRSVSRVVTLDLADLYVCVQSLDKKDVPGATVKISSSGYVLSNVTNSQGFVYFYRILKGKVWSINVTYTTNLGFGVKNDTYSVLMDQSSKNVTVTLPMSDLHVTAVDLLGEVVNEYTAYLYQGDKPVGDPLDQITTGNGMVVFEELPVGNFTLTFKYLARSEYGDKLSPTVVNIWYLSNRNIVVSLPLATLHVVVDDVNNVSIPDVTVSVQNRSGSTVIYYFGVSDESGMVNFTRILYGATWDIRISFDTFGGKGETIEKSLDEIPLDSPQKYIYVELPVTDMVIHVLTEQQYNMSDYWRYGVGGAVVYANITGKMDLVTNATDAAGYAIAKFVPVGRYNVTVYFLEKSWSKVFDVYNNSALHFVLPFKYAQIATRLSVTSPSSPYVNVIWTENITVELTFYVVETNTFIAYGWINWSLVDMQGNTVLSGFGSYDEGHEVYIVSFNSSEVPAGRYTLKIYGGKASYPPPSTEVVVVVEISKVPTELILEKERIRVPVGSDYVSIRVFYKDVFHNASIVNASVILTLENQSYQMMLDEENSGWYVYDLPVSNLSMGVYEVKVYAEKANYEPVERSISLQITEKVIRIGTVSVPRTIFFASIIGIGVPIAGIAGFYVYRYLRVPKVLRTLNKIISKVEKGERIPLEAVADVRSRRDIVSEKVNKLWRGLGIKFGGAREEGKESG